MSTPGASDRNTRLESLEHLVVGADHQAEPSVEPEHAAGHTDVDVVDAERLERRAPREVVHVVCVAAVDHGVSRFQQLYDVGQCSLGDLARRKHEPHGSWGGQRGHELLQGVGPRGAFGNQRPDRGRRHVVHDARVPVAHQAEGEVRVPSARAPPSRGASADPWPSMTPSSSLARRRAAIVRPAFSRPACSLSA